MANVVSTEEGLDQVRIGSQGSMEIEFRNAFQVDLIIVAGTLIVRQSVSISGLTASRNNELS